MESRKLDLESITDGKLFNGEVGVLESAIKTASNGAYLAMKVTDGTTTRQAKMWQYTQEFKPEVGAVIQIRGTGNLYNGNVDLNIKRWHPGTGDINEYRKQSVLKPSVLLEEYKLLLGRIKDVELYRACMCLLESYDTQFLYEAPAAVSVHHDCVGGWLQHSVEVCTLALNMALIYSDSRINLDYVIAGSLLHDVGKLRTYEWKGIAVDMTHAGRFNDHIVEGIRMLSEHGFTQDLLYHIVASHHGKLEYGSPVLPGCIEAYIVSEADMISSRVAIFEEEHKQGTGWSDQKNFYLGRRIWRGEEMEDERR